MSRRQLVTAAVAMGFVLGTAGRATAQDKTAKWTSRVAFGAVLTAGEQVRVLDGEPVSRLSLENGGTLLFDLSRDLSPSVQVTLGFGWMNLPARQIVDQSSNDLDGFRTAEYHLGVTYVLRTPSRVDLYFGPMLVGIGKDIGTATGGGESKPIAMSGAAGPGVQVGGRVKLCGCDTLAIDAGLRWSRLRAPISGGGRYDVDPWLIFVGIAVRH